MQFRDKNTMMCGSHSEYGATRLQLTEVEMNEEI